MFQPKFLRLTEQLEFSLVIFKVILCGVGLPVIFMVSHYHAKNYLCLTYRLTLVPMGPVVTCHTQRQGERSSPPVSTRGTGCVPVQDLRIVYSWGNESSEY